MVRGKTEEKDLGSIHRILHMSRRLLDDNNKRRRTAHAQDHVGILVSRYHRHFVRLRLSLLASQGESELPRVAQVASQHSDERTHILITFSAWLHSTEEWQQLAASPRLVWDG